MNSYVPLFLDPSAPSKPCSQGRGGIDALHANNSYVVRCGGSRCKTCKHLVVGIVLLVM